jgi:hypothetical protein
MKKPDEVVGNLSTHDEKQVTEIVRRAEKTLAHETEVTFQRERNARSDPSTSLGSSLDPSERCRLEGRSARAHRDDPSSV